MFPSAKLPTSRARIGALVVVVVLTGHLLAGCDDAEEGEDDEGLATLDDAPTDAEDTEDAADEAPSAEDLEEAQLAWVQCLREEGIDFPDPPQEPTEEQVQELLSEEGQAAAAVCEEELEGVADVFDFDPEQEAAMRDGLVDWAACMREEGFEVPDPAGALDDYDVPQDVLQQDGFVEADRVCAEDAFGDLDL